MCCAVTFQRSRRKVHAHLIRLHFIVNVNMRMSILKMWRLLLKLIKKYFNFDFYWFEYKAFASWLVYIWMFIVLYHVLKWIDWKRTKIKVYWGMPIEDDSLFDGSQCLTFSNSHSCLVVLICFAFFYTQFTQTNVKLCEYANIEYRLVWSFKHKTYK